ncbi:MAG TPA: molybdopterin molybdenumtransferase MoeA, partial [bacterium]|nr:molybdopterin molybdenumtransferase MoeA [bacterium]
MALHPHQARALVGDLLTPLPPETVPLEDAHHRLLAAPIYADRDLPPTDRAAMDGYACRAADTASPHPLIVTGTVAAGAPAPTAVTPGEAIRIFTGAVVPRGADCVVMQEAVDAVDNQIRVRVPAAVGQHILKRGEDARAGDELLGPGTILDAAQLAVCAAVGATAVAVRRRPRVAVFATGSELKHAADPVAPHEIRSSNTLALAALLRDLGQAEVAV